MMIEGRGFNEIRKNTRILIKDEGINLPDTIPFLDQFEIKPPKALIQRSLCLHAVVSISYGLSIDKAIDWLLKNGIYQYLTKCETKYLLNSSDSKAKANFQDQVECLGTFMWFFQDTFSLELFGYSPEALIGLYPDLDASESADSIKKDLKFRANLELIKMADAYYCLYWLSRNANLKGCHAYLIHSYLIRNRWKTLKWMISDQNWDDIFTID